MGPATGEESVYATVAEVLSKLKLSGIAIWWELPRGLVRLAAPLKYTDETLCTSGGLIRTPVLPGEASKKGQMLVRVYAHSDLTRKSLEQTRAESFWDLKITLVKCQAGMSFDFPGSKNDRLTDSADSD